MFNFLFDGKIGEYLAPVLPTNQLFLAIQHHRNNEVQQMIFSNQSDYRTNSDGGYAAIHVACRYNNIYALDLLAQQGKSSNCDYMDDFYLSLHLFMHALYDF